MTRADAIYGAILALIFAAMCYVGPSEYSTVNATADTGAMYAR